MRKTIRAAVGATLVAGFALASAGIASADQGRVGDCAKISETSICDLWFTHTASGQTTIVSDAVFHAYGEYAVLSDYKADGRGIYMKLTWEIGRTTYIQEIYNTKGAGTAVQKDFSIAEGIVIDFKACQTDDGALLNCVYADMKA